MFSKNSGNGYHFTYKLFKCVFILYINSVKGCGAAVQRVYHFLLNHNRDFILGLYTITTTCMLFKNSQPPGSKPLKMSDLGEYK